MLISGAGFLTGLEEGGGLAVFLFVVLGITPVDCCVPLVLVSVDLQLLFLEGGFFRGEFPLPAMMLPLV